VALFDKKKGADPDRPALEESDSRMIDVRFEKRTNPSALVFGLGQTNRAATLLPLTALFHELHAFKALENGTLTTHCGS
jgi:hypothetical protein